MTENWSVNEPTQFFELFEKQNGIPLLEAIGSSMKTWEQQLQQRQYSENIEKVAELLFLFCRGIKYGYENLSRRGKITNLTTLANINIVNDPKITATYDRLSNNIEISINYLKKFENISLDSVIELKDEENNIKFIGTVEEYIITMGLEEFIHSVDPDIKNIDFSNVLPGTNGNAIKYHAQKHEYKALGWKILLAKNKKFSENAQHSLRNLLQKVIQYRAFLGRK